jgi:hypothetical protein
MTKCSYCGKRIKGRLTKENSVFFKGKYYCRECFEKNFFECDECHQIYEITDRTFTYNRDRICPSCREKFYRLCENCNEFVRYNDSYRTYNGEYICPNCEEEDYYRCEECDELVHRDDVEEYDGYYYCPDCYDNLHRAIYGYHDFEDFYVHHTGEDDRFSPTFGFEIEVEGNRSYAPEVLNKFQDLAVLMDDSSVDGFEIVTQPMTEQYFTTKFLPILKDAMTFLEAKGFKGHNRGGIHIHVSSGSFDLHMIRNLVNILYGSELDRNTWLALSQRKESAMKSWARMTGNRPYEEIDYQDSIDYERHTALNYDERTDTYEFRIFNSNTRVERILKNFEIVLALMAYSKEEEEGYADTKGFLRYIDSRKLFYPNLSAFVQEKGIMEHYNKIYTDEELEVA